MHRFYLPPEQCAEKRLILDGAEAHHAREVLRLERASTVVVLDGAGGEYTAEVVEETRHQVRLVCTETRRAPPPECRVTLLQAVPRGKLFETIIQKATELGVARIVPVISERTTPRFDSDPAGKTEKWRRVAIEAIKQCGCPWLPLVETPVTPAEYLARREPVELGLVASLRPGRRHARVYFQDFQQREKRRPGSVSVWIGPEGDLTPEEVRAIQDAGCRPIDLGPLVLRSDTAAIYSLAIINHELRSPTGAAAS